MEESELATVAPHIVRAMAPGLTTAFGTLLRSGQDRKNLEADRAVIDGILQTGLTNFRYRGLAMEFESFADAHQEEIERLVTNTVNALWKADTVVDWSRVNLDQFNPEFRRRWIFEASNVSDETLQDLWARLLAGELESPSSVSNDTMSIARDLNKERASEFQTLCSAALYNWDRTPMIVVGCGSPGGNSLEPYGLSYDVLMRLAHHRLIVVDMNTGITFLTRPGGRVQPWSYAANGLNCMCFNPHPTRRPSATLGERGHQPDSLNVSILTRPEGRVQLFTMSTSAIGSMFQSSPDPKAECNASIPSFRPSRRSFNPHPTRRPSATSCGWSLRQR